MCIFGVVLALSLVITGALGLFDLTGIFDKGKADLQPFPGANDGLLADQKSSGSGSNASSVPDHHNSSSIHRYYPSNNNKNKSRLSHTDHGHHYHPGRNQAKLSLYKNIISHSLFFTSLASIRPIFS
jgi:hypothetical protein